MGFDRCLATPSIMQSSHICSTCFTCTQTCGFCQQSLRCKEPRPQVMKVAKVLGPRPSTCSYRDFVHFLEPQHAFVGFLVRKMMPNPKSGTVVPNLKTAIKEAPQCLVVHFLGDCRSISSGQKWKPLRVQSRRRRRFEGDSLCLASKAPEHFTTEDDA